MTAIGDNAPESSSYAKRFAARSGELVDDDVAPDAAGLAQLG